MKLYFTELNKILVWEMSEYEEPISDEEKVRRINIDAQQHVVSVLTNINHCVSSGEDSF